MTHWIDVFRYELRQQFRRKAYLFMTFGLPLLAIVIFFGYQTYQDQHKSKSEQPKPVTEVNQGKQTIGYVDQTPQQLFPAPASYAKVSCTPTQAELDTLNAASSANSDAVTTRDAAIKRISSPFCTEGSVIDYASFETGKTALKDGKIDALYVFEPDFTTTGSVSVYVSGFNIQTSSSETLLHDYLLRSLLYEVAPQQYATLYLRLRDPAYVLEHTITDTGATTKTNENRDFLLVYGFGLLQMLTVFWGGGYLMQSVVQEKESRIIEIMLSSLRPTGLLLGKILAMGLLSLLQVGTLVGTFVFILSQAGTFSASLGDVSIGAGLLAAVVVYFLLGFLLFGSLMAAIGAVSTSMRESQNFVTVVTLPAALPFFFISLFASDPNSTLAVVFSMIPITAPLSMIMRLSVASVPAVQIALSIGLLVLSVAGAIWLAGRLFRVNTLLMGHMPKWRDIPRLVRG